MKKEGFRNYRPYIVQALKGTDKKARVPFAQLILDRGSPFPNFLERIMLSDEAVFHLDAGINTHNCSHWSRTNIHKSIEESLNSPKGIVWAAVVILGIIGHFQRQRQWWSVPQFGDWGVLPGFLQLPLIPLLAGWSITTLVPSCDGLAHWELGRPLDTKRWSSRPQYFTSFTWFDFYGFLSVGSYQVQGLYKKLPILGRPSELNLSSFSRSDGRKYVSKREKLGEETENGDWACWCSHGAINYSWENWVSKYKILTIWEHFKTKMTHIGPLDPEVFKF